MNHRTGAAAAGALILALLAGCSSGGQDPEPAMTTVDEPPAAVEESTTDVASDELETTEGPTPATEAEDVDEGERDYGDPVETERGNLLKTIGQWAGMATQEGEQTVDFRVVDIVTDYGCPNDPDAEPANDQFVALEFEIETFAALGDGEFWMHAGDFRAWTETGQRVNDSLGNAIGCATSAEYLPSIIGPAELVSGLIVLDLPADAAAVGFSDPALSSGGWEWEIP
ncbi:hypothetical protein [Pseudactinotalea suaedae]|uniref:hypothetical protein n=1 Tax=Pseudactinotalea suaedae TaxID=1524924 RepID=UPI001390A9D1|nr:hypothetical protein [Pseudactinotalea suaedae]